MPFPDFLNNLISAIIPYNSTKAEQRNFINKLIGDQIPYERLTPEATQEIIGEYHPSIGLGTNVNFGIDAFEKYTTNRINDILKLKEAKTPDDDLIHEKLSKKTSDLTKKEIINAVKESLKEGLNTSTKEGESDLIHEKSGEKTSEPTKKEAINAVKKSFNEALNAPSIIENAKKGKEEYEKSLNAFKNLLAEPSHKYHAQDLIGVMSHIHNDAIENITQQHTEEVAHLTKLFADPKFNQNLKTALDLSTDDDELQKTTESLLEDLKQNHKKQLDEFKNSTTETMNTLHKAAEQQLKAFLFIADLHKNDLKMRQMIEMLAERNRAQYGSNINTEIVLSEDKADISSVNLEQLQSIQQLGGGEIKAQKNADGNMTYSLDMGMKLLNPTYYFLKGQHKQDMLTMAQAIRASGADTITMTVTFKNADVAEERARQAFEACLKSGFPPEKININVNGTMLSYKAKEKDGKKSETIEEKLYSKQGHQFRNLLKQAEDTRSQLEKLLTDFKAQPVTQGKNFESIKSRLEELKEQNQIQEKPETPAPTTPNQSL